MYAKLSSGNAGFQPVIFVTWSGYAGLSDDKTKSSFHDFVSLDEYLEMSFDNPKFPFTFFVLSDDFLFLLDGFFENLSVFYFLSGVLAKR